MKFQLVYDEYGEISMYNENQILACDVETQQLHAVNIDEVKVLFGYTIYDKVIIQLKRQPSNILNHNDKSGTIEYTKIGQGLINDDDFNISIATTSTESSKPSLSWTRNAILRLLYYYKQMENKMKSTTIRNEIVFREISEKLIAESYKFTGTQCRDKFKYLKMNYNKYKDSQKRTGAEYIRFDYIEEFDELFAKKHTTEPVLSSLQPEENKSNSEGTPSNDVDALEAPTTPVNPVIKKRKLSDQEDAIERRHQENLRRKDEPSIALKG